MALTECQTPKGWGNGWGSTPWGGGFSSGATPGGPLPFIPPFDLYCVCGTAMPFIQTYIGVSTTPGSHFTVDLITDDLVVTSVDSIDAFLFIDSLVPQDYTLEFVVNFEALPPNLSDPNNHIFFGVVDNAGFCAGLFFSKTDIAYAGAWNAPATILPGSSGMVTEGEYYVVRIAVNSTIGAVYIYITKVSLALLIGEQLKFILPLIPYTALPPGTQEGTHVHVDGSFINPSIISLDSICLATGALIPNLAPIANAGADQAARLCQIILLDGSLSFDPEGQPLTYKWRLIDGPIESMFVFGGIDGTTFPLPIPTGFTNKFYSTSFAGPGAIPIVVGDVLVVAGKPYNVTGTGSDINGDFVTIDGFFLPDNLINAAFKIIKQNGLQTPTEVKATFFPDVPGFYKFDLVVFDGSIFSDPSVAVVNVLESFLPRGCTPDVKFIWDYLSDFWALVDDRERVETVWSGMTQSAATELYTLWQIEYSKSLRDIQRTFIRRWLHYDLFLREPFPEITTIRTIFRGVDSATFVNGTLAGSITVILSIPFFNDLTQSTVVIPAGASIVQAALQLQAEMQKVDKRITVTAVFVDATHSLLRLNAPFPFTIVIGTTPGTFTVGDTNQPFVQNGGGLLTGKNVYLSPFSLQGIDIKPNDLFYVVRLNPAQDVVVARVMGVADSPTDPLRYQRIITQEALPLDSGDVWGIAQKAVSTQLNFFDGLCVTGDVALFEVTDSDSGGVEYMTSRVLGANEGASNAIAIGTDAAVIPFLARSDRFTIQLWGIYRRQYMPIEDVIVDIPVLQRIIKNPKDSELLRRNADYFIEKFRGKNCIRFDLRIYDVRTFLPLTRLWAEYTFLDNRSSIEGNFGLAVGFTLDDLEKLGTSVDYLSAVRGLWYAFLNGPTVHNLRVGTQILLGLPFAEEDGTIEEIRIDFSPTQGRILIRDKLSTDVVRTYSFPKALTLETNPKTGKPYVVGDSVTQFAPLVTGAEVVDWVKDPTYFQGFLSQGFFYEVEKFHRFLVRVDSPAFSLPSLLFVRNFILLVKPTYTYPLFIVRVQIGDTEISVDDAISYHGKLSLYDAAIFKQPYNQYEILPALNVTYESATMFDQPDPSPGNHPVAGDTPPTPPVGILSGHWVNAFDTSSFGNATGVYPAFPTPDLAVTWGFDRENIAPEMFIVGTARDTRYAAAPALPTFDSVFVFDRPVWANQDPYVFGQSFLLHVPPAPSKGAMLLETITAAPRAMLVNGLELRLKGRPYPPSTAFVLVVEVNGIVVFSDTFTHSSDGQSVYWTNLGPPYTGPPFFLCKVMVAFPIGIGDSVVVYIQPQVATSIRPYFNAIGATLGESVPWTFAVPMPANPQYSLVKLL